MENHSEKKQAAVSLTEWIHNAEIAADNLLRGEEDHRSEGKAMEGSHEPTKKFASSRETLRTPTT